MPEKLVYMEETMAENVIEMNHITKQFGTFKANDDVTLHVRKGEIHALLGENGAGKSTLMSVLFGLYQPEEGEIKIGGKTVKIDNPNDANELGIGMVHQHFKLVHNFTVLESIVLGRETTARGGVLVMDEARKKVQELSDRYKFKIDPDAYISDITVGMQQRVEILKMLYCDNDILIFDEPTAVLMPQEIDELMKVMKQLVAEGKSIVFITHKLKEIKAVADRCSVLRKGKYIGTIDVKNASSEEMSEMMVGRKVNLDVVRKDMGERKPVLQVQNLTVPAMQGDRDAVKNVSFDVKSGEIVTIAGIDGNGQSELVYGITGLSEVKEGKVILNGKDITDQSIRQRSIDGMAHIPEDRHKHGMVLDYNLEQNLILQTYYKKRFQNHGFLKFQKIREYANYLIEKFDIRSSDGPTSSARGMSGGNQQKAVIARELDRDPEVILAVQPVRGLDVGAIEYIHNQLIEQRDAGKAILLVSFELEEVMNMSDRIIVIYEGEIVANLKTEDITSEELGLYMAGAKRSSEYEKN